MIFGIGVDIATVSRVQRTWERFGNRFARRFLHDDELQELTAVVDGSMDGAVERFLAKRFAVKEAAVKALGTGERNGVLLRDFALAHTELGKPLLSAHGVAAEHCRREHIQRLHVSLSDERDTVVAFVVLESASATGS